MSTELEYIQVVIVPTLRPHLEQWLAHNGLTLARMPLNDLNDLPTYGVMPLPDSSADGTTTSNEEQP